MHSDSPFGRINWIDLWKTVRGGLVTFVGFVLVEGMIALQTNLQTCQDMPADCQFDFGNFSIVLPSAVTLMGMAIELVRRLVKDHK